MTVTLTFVADGRALCSLGPVLPSPTQRRTRCRITPSCGNLRQLSPFLKRFWKWFRATSSSHSHRLCTTLHQFAPLGTDFAPPLFIAQDVLAPLNSERRLFSRLCPRMETPPRKPMAVMLESVKELLAAGLSLAYPECCQLCKAARATPRESFICANCRSQVRFIEPPFCHRCGLPFAGAISHEFECSNCRAADWSFCYARSAVVAKDQVLEVIHRYKYHRAVWFEPFLSELLIQRASADLGSTNWDWIVPVPLHPTKLREREFNQAERLAHHLGRATKIPVNTRLLRRVVPTRTQTWLSREERLENVRKAFAFRGAKALDGERIILVDDVFTTGATTGACARVLRQSGAGEVCVWTVARGV